MQSWERIILENDSNERGDSYQQGWFKRKLLEINE